MLEGDYIKMWIEYHILFLEYRDGLVLDQEIAREILNSRLVFQQDREYPVFCDTSGILSAEPEALEILAAEGVLLIRAIAFYTKSPLDNLLTEYFIKTYRKHIPAEVFNHKHQAIQFLKPYSQ
jgi:hypothetical protein